MSETEDPSSGEVELDFEFHAIKVIDRTCIQGMLCNLLEPLKLSPKFKLTENLLAFARHLTVPLKCEHDEGTDVEESEHYGTTVKNDKDEAPLALLAPVDIRECLSASSLLQALKDTNAPLKELIDVKLKGKSLTWLLKLDTVLNMPPQVALQLYRILLDEQESDENLVTDYYLVITRTFRLVASSVDAESDGSTNQKRKKTRTSATADQPEEFYFSEDQLLQEFSDFECPLQMLPLDKQPHVRVADSRRLFTDEGSIDHRRLFILSLKNLKQYFQCLQKAFV